MALLDFVFTTAAITGAPASSVGRTGAIAQPSMSVTTYTQFSGNNAVDKITVTNVSRIATLQTPVRSSAKDMFTTVSSGSSSVTPQVAGPQSFWN